MITIKNKESRLVGVSDRPFNFPSNCQVHTTCEQPCCDTYYQMRLKRRLKCLNLHKYKNVTFIQYKRRFCIKMMQKRRLY
jgi:protein gp37